MSSAGLRIPASVFSVDVEHLAPHCNPAPCVIAGRRGSVSAIGAGERITGDVLFIRPGVEHEVVCAEGGLNVIYLDGLTWPDNFPCARRLQGRLGEIAVGALFQQSGAQAELRDRLSSGSTPIPRPLDVAIETIVAEPMLRLSQLELAHRLKMERTRALRAFKAATGLTFRRFKRWSALQHAARRIAAGELVRTAALDAGFADTAHLSRTFRTSFGLTPSEAIAAGARVGAR
ncbi:MAG: AraC family transcriptional regulator [Reyranellaceae bacterium]